MNEYIVRLCKQTIKISISEKCDIRRHTGAGGAPQCIKSSIRVFCSSTIARGQTLGLQQKFSYQWKKLVCIFFFDPLSNKNDANMIGNTNKEENNPWDFSSPKTLSLHQQTYPTNDGKQNWNVYQMPVSKNSNHKHIVFEQIIIKIN